MVQDIIRMVIANGGHSQAYIPKAEDRDYLISLGFFVTPVKANVPFMYRVTRLPHGF